MRKNNYVNQQPTTQPVSGHTHEVRYTLPSGAVVVIRCYGERSADRELRWAKAAGYSGVDVVLCTSC